MIKPKNNELTAYILLSNKLVSTKVARPTPTTQPVPSLNKNQSALSF